VNGLSDHDDQLISINNVNVTKWTQKRFYKYDINKNTIAEFQLRLSWEQWDDIFENTYVNNMF
jgi:hypothetical protein